MEMTNEDYIKKHFNRVDNMTAMCITTDALNGKKYPELMKGIIYTVTHIAVFKLGAEIVLEEFGNKPFDAICFNLYENGKFIDDKYTQDERFWAPELREGNQKEDADSIEKNNFGAILGQIGSAFQSNIEKHIIDYKLSKEDNVEWMLEPLTEISHPCDLVLGAFNSGLHTGWSYHLYLHNKDASSIYKPYDVPISMRDIEAIAFLGEDGEERPVPNTYDKSMLIKEKALDIFAAEMIPEIWDELTIPFTETGIWQAVLLDESRAMLPKGWHHNYMRKDYVFSREDMEGIVNGFKWGKRDFDKEKLSSFLGRDDVLPSVVIDGDKAIVTYYYWNNWSGFCRRIISVERHGNSVIIGEKFRKVLVKYRCGIKY